jgi:hypothetical protein
MILFDVGLDLEHGDTAFAGNPTRNCKVIRRRTTTTAIVMGIPRTRTRRPTRRWRTRRVKIAVGIDRRTVSTRRMSVATTWWWSRIKRKAERLLRIMNVVTEPATRRNRLRRIAINRRVGMTGHERTVTFPERRRRIAKIVSQIVKAVK